MRYPIALSSLIVASVWCLIATAAFASPADPNTAGPAYSVTFTPARIEYGFLTLYPRKEVSEIKNPARRHAEIYYPADFSLLCGISATLDPVPLLGSYFGFSAAFKNPLGIWETPESVRGKFQFYTINNYWKYFGLDLLYTSSSGAFHQSVTQNPATGSPFSVHRDFKTQSASVNSYFRIFDLTNRDNPLAALLDPGKKAQANQAYVSFLFLSLSYDYQTVRSGENLITPGLQPYFNNDNFNRMDVHLGNLALMVGWKARFFGNCFFSAIGTLASAYYADERFNGKKTRIKGVESIYTSLDSYRDYSENGLEGYTKSILHTAMGYNGDNLFCYVEFFYDIKNYRNADTVIQSLTYFMQLCMGVRW